MAYAKGTKTEISKSEDQIKTMLRKAGADAIAMMEEPASAVVAFHLHGRSIRFRLPLPRREAFERSATGRQERSASTITAAWMQASRERWRQLHLCIKAKLESVEQEIELFDDAFLSQIVTPDGMTIGEKVKPQMTALMDGQPLRPLLAGPSA